MHNITSNIESTYKTLFCEKFSDRKPIVYWDIIIPKELIPLIVPAIIPEYLGLRLVSIDIVIDVNPIILMPKIIINNIFKNMLSIIVARKREIWQQLWN